jgi:hypothetical protein
VYSVKEIGLAGAIQADKTIEPGRQIQCMPGVILELGQFYGKQVQGNMLFQRECRFFGRWPHTLAGKPMVHVRRQKKLHLPPK